MMPALLDIQTYDGQGYKPLVDFESWRVAILNYDPDEVFVLLRGRCILFVGEGRDSVDRIHAEDLQPHRLYTVRQAVWHTHTLSSDAKVLVIENRNTTYGNSPFAPLSNAQRQQLIRMTGELWLASGS